MTKENKINPRQRENLEFEWECNIRWSLTTWLLLGCWLIFLPASRHGSNYFSTLTNAIQIWISHQHIVTNIMCHHPFIHIIFHIIHSLIYIYYMIHSSISYVTSPIHPSISQATSMKITYKVHQHSWTFVGLA
jgi:hypothetical protein